MESSLEPAPQSGDDVVAGLDPGAGVVEVRGVSVGGAVGFVDLELKRVLVSTSFSPISRKEGESESVP